MKLAPRREAPRAGPAAGRGARKRRASWQAPGNIGPDDLKRCAVTVGGFLVLAVMLGPSGSSAAPLSGFAGSLLHPRALYFVGVGLGVWALSTLWRRKRQAVRAAWAQAWSGPRRSWADWRVRSGTYAAALAAAVVVPLGLSNFWQTVLVQQIGVYILLSLGLNVVVGFAGLLDLGYVGFYAVGAYSAAYWTGSLPAHPPFVTDVFWSIPIAMAAAILAGVILGVPTLRLRGDYLAIVTLGFGEIIEIVLQNLASVTGGPAGVTVPRLSVHFLGINYNWGVAPLPYYFLLLAFIVAVLAGFHLLDHSRVGRAWAAIREDEVAAEACGVNVLKYKVLAFAIGASTSGFAGVLTATEFSYINPGNYTVNLSIMVLVLVIFGGMGSLLGSMAGAAVIVWFQWYLEEHPLLGYQQQDLFIYIGALLIVMMIFRPEGIIPSHRRRREIGLAEVGAGRADAMGPQGGPLS
jgi:branched-chain amino acid transport system permease protein